MRRVSAGLKVLRNRSAAVAGSKRPSRSRLTRITRIRSATSSSKSASVTGPNSNAGVMA